MISLHVTAAETGFSLRIALPNRYRNSACGVARAMLARAAHRAALRGRWCAGDPEDPDGRVVCLPE